MFRTNKNLIITSRGEPTDRNRRALTNGTQQRCDDDGDGDMEEKQKNCETFCFCWCPKRIRMPSVYVVKM